MCVATDDSYLFIANPGEERVTRIQFTDKLLQDYNTYRGNEVEVEYRAEFVDNVNGITCDQYSNLVYFFNSMDNNQED